MKNIINGIDLNNKNNVDKSYNEEKHILEELNALKIKVIGGYITANEIRHDIEFIEQISLSYFNLMHFWFKAINFILFNLNYFDSI